MKQSFRKFIIGATQLLVTLILFSYCKNPTTMSAGTASKDSTIHVRAGESFTIKLEAEVGQGYSWKLADSSLGLVSIEKKESFEPVSKSVPGSGGTQVFYFKALKQGKQVIEFIYVQPFVKPAPVNALHKKFIVLIQ